MGGIVSRGRRGSVVVPNWRTEDQSLDAYAFRIACWLASHADHYTEATVSRNLIAKVLGVSRAKASDALAVLEERGIIAAEAIGERGRLVITFDFEVWEDATDDRTPRVQSQDATRPVTGRHASCTKGDTGEDQKSAVAKATEPTLRDRANTLVNDWWDSLAVKPAQPYIAIVKVVENCMKGGWSESDIAAALRETPTVSGAAFDLWRNTRESRSTNDAWIVELLAESATFFEQRDLLAWRHENVDALKATIRTLGAWGFDRGETMIRLAVGARHPQDMTNPTKLSRLPRIDRFEGLPADLPRAMETAYRNLRWSAQ